MSSDEELHSKVIKVVEKLLYSVADIDSAYSAAEAIQAFLFDPHYIMAW